MSKITFFTCLIVLLGFISCRKKPLPVPSSPEVVIPDKTKGTLNLIVNNVVGMLPLTVGGKESYTLPNGESLTVRSYEYYLSNFVFYDEQGNKYIEPESYHLINAQKPESLNFTVNDVPFGIYKRVEFLIGVDSIRNISGAQVGALDTKHGMFWSWSNGYIMARLEGNSPQSTAPNGAVSYHIGGFKGTYSVVRKVSIDFPQSANVTKRETPGVFIQADLNKWFQSFGFTPFSFSKTSTIVSEGPEAFSMSQNYSSMFSITKITN